MDKNKILTSIIQALEASLTLALESAKDAHQASTDEENIPEHKYDTLALEASYLAEGQAKRVKELESSLSSYRAMAPISFNDESPIDLGAYVCLEKKDGKYLNVFIGPDSGGIKIEIDKIPITIISLSSPLAQKLLGKFADDSIEIIHKNTTLTYEIIDVH